MDSTSISHGKFLDGTVKISIAWNGSIGGNVSWDITLQSYALGDNLDKNVTSVARTVVGTSPGSIANALCESTLSLLPCLQK